MNTNKFTEIPATPVEIRVLAAELIEHAHAVEREHYESVGRWVVDNPQPFLDADPGEQFHLVSYTSKSYSDIWALPLDTDHVQARTALPGETWDFKNDSGTSTLLYVGQFELVHRFKEDRRSVARFAEVASPHYSLEVTVPGITRAAQAMGVDPAKALVNATRRAMLQAA